MNRTTEPMPPKHTRSTTELMELLRLLKPRWIMYSSDFLFYYLAQSKVDTWGKTTGRLRSRGKNVGYLLQEDRKA
jgi:hypothetical protein